MEHNLKLWTDQAALVETDAGAAVPPWLGDCDESATTDDAAIEDKAGAVAVVSGALAGVDTAPSVVTEPVMSVSVVGGVLTLWLAVDVTDFEVDEDLFEIEAIEKVGLLLPESPIKTMI